MAEVLSEMTRWFAALFHQLYCCRMSMLEGRESAPTKRQSVRNGSLELENQFLDRMK